MFNDNYQWILALFPLLDRDAKAAGVLVQGKIPAIITVESVVTVP